ncbi:hypothetical protein Q1695_013002 [Nippostrongylus brasiliensis]|nr:hypothetical protein Q1695_013002 [Nippostrongylus brasiliensis]
MSDAIGNVRDWWTRASAQKYENRSQCFVEQYGNVLVPGTALHLNGKTTQGENIADNGGVKLAFRAYKKYLERHGREKPIAGFARYSNEQMFFMGYAVANCARYTKDALMNKIVTDAHPPSKYRVNVGLANQPEFAEAFKCRVGTPMNPHKRCNIW